MESKETAIALPKRKRNKDDGELDITPMIDITFLLLSFFVVVSKMDPNTAVQLPRAKHGNSIQESTSVILVVKISPTEEPAVFKGKSGTERITGSTEDIEDAIQAYVIDEFSKDPLKKNLIIKAERKVIHRHVNIVKKAASAAMLELGEDYVLNVGIEQE
jgi:biopolymer transport protein ExbD